MKKLATFAAVVLVATSGCAAHVHARAAAPTFTLAQLPHLWDADVAEGGTTAALRPIVSRFNGKLEGADASTVASLLIVEDAVFAATLALDRALGDDVTSTQADASSTTQRGPT